MAGVRKADLFEGYARTRKPDLSRMAELVEMLSVRLNEPTPRSLYELNLPGFALDASN